MKAANSTRSAAADQPVGRAPHSTAQPVSSNLPPELQRIQSLMAKAAQGDAAAAHEVEEFFAHDSPVWQTCGNLAEAARMMLERKFFSNSPALGRSVKRQIAHQIESLVDADAPPLEKLAAERLVMASTMASAADVMAMIMAEPSHSMAKIQELAERRVQTAMKTLQLAREMGRAGGGLKVFVSVDQPPQSEAV